MQISTITISKSDRDGDREKKKSQFAFDLMFSLICLWGIVNDIKRRSSSYFD